MVNINDGLNHFSYNTKLYQKLLMQFDLAKHIGEFDRSLKQNEVAEVKKQLKVLKGMAEDFGLETLFNAVCCLESSPMDETLLGNFMNAVRQTESEIQAYLGPLGEPLSL